MNVFLFMLLETPKVNFVNSQNYINKFYGYPPLKSRIYKKNYAFKAFKRPKQGFKRQFYGRSNRR